MVGKTLECISFYQTNVQVELSADKNLRVAFISHLRTIR